MPNVRFGYFQQRSNTIVRFNTTKNFKQLCFVHLSTWTVRVNGAQIKDVMWQQNWHLVLVKWKSFARVGLLTASTVQTKLTNQRVAFNKICGKKLLGYFDWYSFLLLTDLWHINSFLISFTFVSKQGQKKTRTSQKMSRGLWRIPKRVQSGTCVLQSFVLDTIKYIYIRCPIWHIF